MASDTAAVVDGWRAAVGQEPVTSRGRRSRDRLLSAARVVFARDGFQGARITDIAEEAQVSHGSFYTYFDSKEAVFWALILRMQDEMLHGADDRHDEVDVDPYAVIERANRDYLAAYARNRDLSVTWEQVAAVDAGARAMLVEAKRPFVQRTERAIAQLRAQGLVDERIDPTYAAHALTGMVSRFAFAWFSQDLPFELDRAVEQLTLLWARSLGIEERAR